MLFSGMSALIQKSPFAYYRKFLNPTTFKVYSYLHDQATNHPQFEVEVTSHCAISAECGLCDTTVSKAINDLKRNGAVRELPRVRFQTGKRFWVHVSNDSSLPEPNQQVMQDPIIQSSTFPSLFEKLTTEDRSKVEDEVKDVKFADWISSPAASQVRHIVGDGCTNQIKRDYFLSQVFPYLLKTEADYQLAYDVLRGEGVIK